MFVPTYHPEEGGRRGTLHSNTFYVLLRDIIMAFFIELHDVILIERSTKVKLRIQ